jgi:adenylate cyclase
MTRLRDLVGQEPPRGIKLPAWLERIVSVGIVSDDEQVVERQRAVNVAAFASAAAAFSHLIRNALHDFDGLLWVNVDNLVILTGALLVPRLHRFGSHAGAVALAVLVLIGQMCFAWLLGRASGLHIYYTLGGAMLFFFGVENWRLFLFFLGLYVGALIIVLNLAPIAGLAIPWDQEFRDQLAAQGMVNATVFMAAMLFYALWDRDRTRAELKWEHARSEALIATVMPQPIAARLKSGREQRIADRIDVLTVLFADLSGFTAAAHDLPPEEIVDFLDGLVRSFDALCECHGVEKIKTIGDGYMAAAGFDGCGERGAVAAGRLALDMMAMVARQPPLGGRTLRLRVGIHCGPATAGVIGDTRLSYDVWGDAVNTAARMESHGEPGCIQVSTEFRALAGDAFIFEERGDTEIKGIGVTRTHFLRSAPA